LANALFNSLITDRRVRGRAVNKEFKRVQSPEQWPVCICLKELWQRRQ